MKKKRTSKLLGNAYEAAVKQTMDKLSSVRKVIEENTRKNKGNSKYWIKIIKNPEYKDE